MWTLNECRYELGGEGQTLIVMGFLRQRMMYNTQKVLSRADFKKHIFLTYLRLCITRFVYTTGLLITKQARTYVDPRVPQN